MTSPPAISISRPPSAARLPWWMASAPTIVAESLAAVPEPLATALEAGPAAPAREVVSALARSLAPAEADVGAPAWLWPEHHRTLRRVVAAVRRHHGCMLADPVGSGKTYVALAAAAALGGGRPACCIVPAALVTQWCRTARRLGVPAVVWSHERVSRGGLPCGAMGLVVIDESHHYRNPDTRRYRALAPWLVRRRALLLTATPTVNRLSDVTHQLRLVVRDDALAVHGVPSLTAMLDQGPRGHRVRAHAGASGGRGTSGTTSPAHAALGHVIFTRTLTREEGHPRPAALERAVPLDDGDMTAVLPLLSELDRLQLAANPAVAGLLRGVFWHAGASSPAALLAALRRYRRLLLHARDAERAGLKPARAELLRMTGGLGEQLLLWEMLGSTDGSATGGLAPGEIALDDLAPLEVLLSRAAAAADAPDGKVAKLAELLDDDRPTLVFAAARGTVRHLRDHLAARPIAWCTGAAAGIGRLHAPRDAVLGWFARRQETDRNRSHIPLELAPLHLVATDVLAEGLDLRRAARVVHYDLAWTPARLAQREGRARRAASAHAEVELVRFHPAPAVESRLRQLAVLAAKDALPAQVGLGSAGRRAWQWRADIADRFAGGPASAGVAAVRSDAAGVLAGFALSIVPGSGEEPALVGTWLLWRDARGRVTQDPDLIAARLDAAATLPDAPAPDRAAVTRALDALGPPIRDRIRAVRTAYWDAPTPTPCARRLVARLHALTRAAARRRDAGTLARLERALDFAAGGHTAGEAMMIEQIARATDAELLAGLGRLPLPAGRGDALRPTLTGLVFFRPP
ncbi:MAG TPA: helicase-related protein [Gemmatimonadales bacterium]|nr:helicase-related protein [Gemmatimonadales bacterium]